LAGERSGCAEQNSASREMWFGTLSFLRRVSCTVKEGNSWHDDCRKRSSKKGSQDRPEFNLIRRLPSTSWSKTESWVYRPPTAQGRHSKRWGIRRQAVEKELKAIGIPVRSHQKCDLYSIPKEQSKTIGPNRAGDNSRKRRTGLGDRADIPRR